MSPARLPLYLATMALAALALTACGGSGLGNNAGPAPDAVITPIGYKAITPSGSSTPQITVRSGANVVLSAKDSDGRGIALSGWTWNQTSGPALPTPPDVRALIYRTDNTVSFRAPDVTTATALGFQVKVSNAKGASSTAEITVNVVPGEDPDRFLTQPTSAPRFEVAVLTADGMETSPAVPLSTAIPVCLEVQRKVVYMGRDGNQKTVSLPQLASLKAEATWAAGTVVEAVNPPSGTPPSSGTAAYDDAVQSAASSYSNPRVDFDIPEFNDDELFAKYNQPGTADSSMQLVPSDIDSAQLQLTVVATPGSCDGTPPPAAFGTSQLILAILDGSGKSVIADSGPGSAGGTVELAAAGVTAGNPAEQLTPDWLLSEASSGQPVENAALAEAYYEAIDPQAKNSAGHYIDPALDPAAAASDSKATLNGWLADNCFDPNSPDYGTSAAGANGAHATYTNNYDLGFGRDMYFMRCTSSYIAAHPNVTAQPGDVASIVWNYQDLEQAAAKDNPPLAVAMEWSLDPSTGKHITKFYVYAPDDRTGTFYRVLSANFDGRGQKYVPNSCMACHGGTPPAIPSGFAGGMSYPSSEGDVDSAFLPFDLDSFLYSDTDPAFGGQLAASSGYTRGAQQANLKILNAFVYQIYADSTECEMSPSGEVAGATDPCGTQGKIDRFAAAKALIEKWYGGAPTDPGNSNPYCDSDSCEYSGYPATPSGWSGYDSVYHGVFARYCRTCHTLNASVGSEFSSAQTFLSLSKSTPYTFIEGLMPDARLTMDRFWADYNGDATSAGQSLAQALPATPALGEPSINALSDDVSNSDTEVRVDAADSYFLPGYSWTLAFESTTPGAAIPDCSSLADDNQLVGATTGEPAFLVDKPGCYKLTLSPPGAATQTVYEHTFSVTAKPLQLMTTPPSGCPGSQTMTYTSGASETSVSLNSCLATSGNPPYILSLSADAGSSWSTSALCSEGGATSPSGAWTACEICPQSAIPAAGIDAGACDQVPSVQVTFGSGASSGTMASVLLKVCDSNGSCVPTNPSAAPISVTLGNPPTFYLSMPSVLTFYWSDGTGNGLAGDSSLIPVCASSPDCTSQPPFGTQTPYGSAIFSISGYLGTAGSSWSLALSGTSPFTTSPASVTNASAGDLSAVTLAGFSSLSPLITCNVGGTSCSSYELDARLDSGVSGGSTACSTPSLPTTFTSGTSSCTTALHVVPLAGFSSQLYTNELSSSCSRSCHGSSANTLAQSYWIYATSSESSTYDCIMRLSGSSCATDTSTLVSPGHPKSSAFYQACAYGFGSMAALGPSSLACKTIYQWILEGAPDD